jgi:hypothetical protein
MPRRLLAIFAGAVLLLGGFARPALAAEPLTLTASLTGAAEVPPAVTRGTGRAEVVINAERTELRYRITYQGLSGPLRLAAFCIGWSTSDVVCPFIGSELSLRPSPLRGTRSIVGIQAQNWVSGQAWVQLETAAHPQGEIRGLLSAVPATSTIPDGRGAPVDSQAAIFLIVGVIGAWVFLRRLAVARFRSPIVGH